MDDLILAYSYRRLMILVFPRLEEEALIMITL